MQTGKRWTTATLVLLALIGRQVMSQSAKADADSAAVAGQQGSQNSSTNATMADTINFINDAYRHQGIWHSVDAGRTTDVQVSNLHEEKCVLLMDLDVRKNDPLVNVATHKQSRVHLFLTESDPLSIAVENDIVWVNKASVIADRLAVPVPPSNPINLGTKDVFQGGFITQASPSEIVFAGEDDKYYRLKLPAHDLPPLTQDNIPSVLPEKAQAGDYIWIWGRNKLYGPAGIFISHPRMEFSAPAQYTRFDFTPFTDAAMAPRVAKALVHAMVLCHKNDSISPF